MTNTATPQIGFDRFIKIEWVNAAFKYRAGLISIDELNDLLDAAGLGKEARIKTRTKLNALVLGPKQDLADFADRGIELFKDCQSTPIAAFAWGMAIATYPFFGRVAEITGRLTSIQADCSSFELNRRICEEYGDREVIKRATQATIQTQASWGAIERVEKGKRLIRKAPLVLTNDRTIAWLIESTLRYTGKAVSVPTMQSMPVIFPFEINQPLAYVLSNSPYIELRSEGFGNQIVDLSEKR